MRCSSLVVSGLLAARAAAQLATFDRCRVRIEALERGGGCLAVDAAAVNATLAPPEGTTACDDSATWTDGTNGCAQYEAAAARGVTHTCRAEEALERRRAARGVSSRNSYCNCARYERS